MLTLLLQSFCRLILLHMKICDSCLTFQKRYFFVENLNLDILEPFLLEPFPIRTFSNQILFQLEPFPIGTFSLEPFPLELHPIRTFSYQSLFQLELLPIRTISLELFPFSPQIIRSFSIRTFSDQTLFQLEPFHLEPLPFRPFSYQNLFQLELLPVKQLSKSVQKWLQILFHQSLFSGSLWSPRKTFKISARTL